jgi:spore coat protein A, manganese oxidase
MFFIYFPKNSCSYSNQHNNREKAECQHLKCNSGKKRVSFGQVGGRATTPLPLPGTLIEIPTLQASLPEDAHPIHLHLISMQLKDRQAFDVDAFTTQWQILNGTILPLNRPTVKLRADSYLTGSIELPTASEQGWKDTIIAPPGKVTRLLVRLAPQEANDADLIPGVNPFPFDPTTGPGYVWHCHILDHEDNDMMRPLKVVAAP